MCESAAYVVEGGKETLFLKDVVRIVPLASGQLRIENLLGEQREFSGRIQEIDFMAHKIILSSP